MTPPAEPNDLTDETRVDTWFARQHEGMGADLASALGLETGLHEIMLAGQHRDMGSTLADALDLDAGLAAILPHHKQHLPAPTTFDSFTDLLDWLSAVPLVRLTHRNQLRLLAIDSKILHLAFTRALDRALNRALDRDLNRDRERDRERGLDLALSLSLARDLAHDRARDLAQTLCGMLVTVEVEDLLCAISGRGSVDMSWLAPATIGPRETDRLNKLVVDFTGVDLREATLSGLDLLGVRWSRTTRWPPADVDWIVAASEPVGAGIYVIQGSSANGGVTVVPDPVSV